MCSGSIPVSMPKGIIVVNDCTTHFKEDVIMLNDEGREEPLMTIEEDYGVALDESDGYGLMSPELAARWSAELGLGYVSSGFCSRYAYEKGMIFPFDFHAFAEKVAGRDEITDAWGYTRKVSEAELILTTSMLKLWSAYPNLETYLENCEKNTSMIDAFSMADDVLRQGVQGISDLISESALINVDFADVRSVMTDRGIAHMGVGHGKGDNRAKDAVQAAIESPLLETHISGAKAILLYVAGGYDLGMMEVSEIADIVEKEASDDAILIFGASVEESMNDEVSITVIATGFDEGLGVEDDIVPASNSSEGISTKEVTLDEIFSSDSGNSDDGSFKIPGFLNK